MVKTENPDDKTKKQRSKWPLLISLILLVLLVSSYFFVPSVGNFIDKAYRVLTSGNEKEIATWVSELGASGPLFITAAMVIQMFLIVIPSPLLMAIAILAYGPLWGSLLAVFSVFTASSVGYFIGRYLGIHTVDRIIGQNTEQKLEYYIRRFGFWAVVATRLSPTLSNDAISFVGGILRMRYWRFIGATLTGIIPLTVLFAYFGENNDRLKTGLIWISVLGLVTLAGYVLYDLKVRKSGGE